MFNSILQQMQAALPHLPSYDGPKMPLGIVHVPLGQAELAPADEGDPEGG